MLKPNMGRAPSLGKQVIKGVLWAVGWTLTASLMAAWLVDREVLRMERIGYASMLILLICGILLARMGSAGVGKTRIYGAGISTGVYFLSLLTVNWLFFGGKFAGFGTALMVLAIGAAMGSMQPRQGRGGVPRRRYKIPKA